MKQKLIRKIMQIQDELVREMYGEVIKNVPMRTGTYLDSIEVREPTLEGDVISSSVFTNLMVDNEGWGHVPLASFIEWGTGPLGEGSNKYPHGYPYTTDEPWNWIAELQFLTTGTWGMEARPHFYPALQATIPKYKRALEKAFK